MQIYKLSDMKDGWFVGGFLPTAFTTDKFEVCYKKHYANEYWDTHYHSTITEINLLVKGKMKINDIEINAGEIFVIPPYYVSKPEFLQDCELVIIKTPSVIGDKFIIKNSL